MFKMNDCFGDLFIETDRNIHCFVQTEKYWKFNYPSPFLEYIMSDGVMDRYSAAVNVLLLLVSFYITDGVVSYKRIPASSNPMIELVTYLIPYDQSTSSRQS